MARVVHNHGMTIRSCILLSSLLSTAAPAQNLDEVYRCEDATGQRIFSDQPCSAHDALPLPSPDDPYSPAEKEIGLPDRAGNADDEQDEVFDPASLPTPLAAEGCAGIDPPRLAAALGEAIAAGDSNRLAAMFHWQGAGRGTAASVFRQVRGWIARAPVEARLVRAEHADDWLYAGLPPPLPGYEALPDIELSAEGDLIGRLGLIRNAGCVWLLPYRNMAAVIPPPTVEPPPEE